MILSDHVSGLGWGPAWGYMEVAKEGQPQGSAVVDGRGTPAVSASQQETASSATGGQSFWDFGGQILGGALKGLFPQREPPPDTVTISRTPSWILPVGIGVAVIGVAMLMMKGKR